MAREADYITVQIFLEEKEIDEVDELLSGPLDDDEEEDIEKVKEVDNKPEEK